MPHISSQQGSDYSAATIVPHSGLMSGLSDDECIQRLADAVENNDDRNLEELASLMGRLAITIE